ncbi:PKD domain-containing protein [Pseudobacter ginsenosidimutans]|uniref:Gliding motility-associated-like protein n=1 Tax=Pseudobacter ginsenosidimutans TaxID=661488 RepID=A0A4Q7MQD6_9BACT|nr:PKD domain-containing protein [Pseudobacter ginsenosidimutans]QEC42242.1 PKD domain-containing protein [Pseudobacter ginsenosidimutans]RZS70915.1 gliding motility-associated-like protein [Pseudobacter ginsenosidimutans]
MKRLWLCTLVLLALLQEAAAQAPVAAFSSNRQSGCAPLGVAFRDESSNSPKYWSWDFGNGQFSNLQNPSVTYAQPGTYTVTLTVRNGDGTHSITRTNYITVSESPQANFIASQTIACAPSSIQFTDRSVPNNSPITEWYWDFGDGTTSNQQNPVKSYTEPGFYTVSLRVTSASGCVASRSVGRMIRITPGVTADFNFTPPPTCRAPFNVNFSNQTSGPGTLTYQWNFGNSTSSTTTDPTAIYTATGTFNVTLTARSQYGCSNTITKPVTISTPVTDFSGPAGACLNTLVTFTDASSKTAISSSWSLGNGETSDQPTATATYTAPGTYNIKIVNTYGACKDSITKPIVVSDKPAVDFSAPSTSACQAPFTVNFRANAPAAATWLWNFGDGNTSAAQNPSHTYTREGDFNVTLSITNADGCSNTITKNAFVRIRQPQIRFTNTPAGGCIPFRFSPRANVSAPDGVRSYAWDFGNGQTGTGPTPVANYTTEGKFALTLTVVTNGGCTQTYTLPDAVETGTRKTAAFRANSTDICAAAEVRFANLSDAGTDEWLWDFGDGNTSVERNPSHRYRDTGNFTVQLIAYYQKCPSLPVTTVIHNKPPLASLQYTADCSVDNRYNFINTSKVDNSLPVSYLWDFGDGNTSTAASPPARTYAGPGPYQIRLRVTNGSCTHTATRNLVLADESPEFRISPQPACTNSPVMLETINSDPAKIHLYFWSINGGPFVTGDRNHEVNMPNPGNYNVRLRIADIHNCIRTSPAQTIVINGPRARFTPSIRGTCRNNAITFTNQTTSAVTISQWIFDFGDGTTSTFTAPPFTHRYADTGTYIVKLTAVDANGCQGVYTDPLPVRISGPTIGFRSDYTTVCPRTNITFTDTSSANILRYRWDFGDGSTSTQQNPVHAFQGTDGNTFRIKLEVTDANGCTDSVVRNDYVILKTPKPALDIEDTTTICPPLQTKFFNRSQDYESFYWDFGDGGASSLDEPDHFYNGFGTYTAKLYVIGIGGCLDSVSRIVRVIDPAANTNVNFSPTSACDTLVVDFTITTPDYTSFTFNFGDGASDNTQSKNLQHMYTAPNNYRPTITLRDNMGCQVTRGFASTVQILGAEVLFGMDRKRFCDEGQIFFTDYTRPRFDPILSREWNFGDGITSTEDHPSHRYTEPGTYYPTLTAVTGAGCSSVMVDTVRVFRTPAPLIDGGPTVCINSELPLRATLQVPDTAITWKWEPGGNGETSTVKYGASGTYTVRLQATNLLGCSGNTSTEIQVPPLPVITVQQDPVIPVGGSITLPVSYTGDIVSWNWVPAKDLSCNDCPNPVASPKFTTKYVVQVTDQYGCTNNQGITVNVQCNDKNYFVPNTFSPNNDGHNDRFYPRGSNITRINSMKIFNRWGELLFERRNFAANDPAAGWDGTAKGKPADPDVYIYVIEFICENAAIVPFRGNVMLLK